MELVKILSQIIIAGSMLYILLKKFNLVDNVQFLKTDAELEAQQKQKQQEIQDIKTSIEQEETKQKQNNNPEDFWNKKG